MKLTPGHVLDREDVRRVIGQHSSGEQFVIEYCSVWDTDNNCVGTQTMGVSDALHYTDLRSDLWAYDVDGDDAEWWEAEEAAGKTSYPFGG